MARVAGTSDRMLIYHFGSKDALLTEVLTAIATDLALRLDAVLPAGPATDEHSLAQGIAAALRDPEVQPTFRIWLEILAMPAYRELAGVILDGFRGWIAVRLPTGTKDPDTAVAAFLTFTEGAVVLGTAGRMDWVDGAIARLFPPGGR